MIQSLRIKEDAYNNIFFDKCKALELVSKNQEMVRKAQVTVQNADAKQQKADTKLVTTTEHGNFYKREVKCLRNENKKLQGKLDIETGNNIGLYKKWHDGYLNQ